VSPVKLWDAESAIDRSDRCWFCAQLRSAGPALLFGLRLWAAVSLALYIAYWLELDNAYWAATSAAVVCQPSVGASLRKASFRMVGTAIGAIAILVITACFPQGRALFLVSLATWAAACCFMAMVLRNFASYGAALAGITAVIVANDELGATGGVSGDVFTLAVTRVSEICIGIVCAGIVMAGTDFGHARSRLSKQFAVISAQITAGLTCAFTLSGPIFENSRSTRWELTRRVIALDPLIDQVMGEVSHLRYRSWVLQASVDALFTALAAWRTVADHLEHLPYEQRRQETGAILRSLPCELRSAPIQVRMEGSAADPDGLRRVCRSTARALVAFPADTPSLRMLADRTAEALTGISGGLNGLLLLSGPSRNVPRVRMRDFRTPDLFPAFLAAVRAFLVIGVAECFWIVTAWPGGGLAMTWSAIFITVFSPAADQAYSDAKVRLLGVVLTAAIAALVKFALLPASVTFVGLSLALGIVLVPAGALSTLSWQAAIFGSVASWFVPLVTPENQITYDTQQFYNSAIAIVVGAAAATLAFRLLPPLSPAFRARRLLALALRDLRRLVAVPSASNGGRWRTRVYGRLSALPEQAIPLQRAELLAALSVGTEIIRLRRAGNRLRNCASLDCALQAISRGESVVAIEYLAEADRFLAGPLAGMGATFAFRMRASILAISEVLAQHAGYFDGEEIR
jgi:uncharacterized membrane protein YccC